MSNTRIQIAKDFIHATVKRKIAEFKQQLQHGNQISVGELEGLERMIDGLSIEATSIPENPEPELISVPKPPVIDPGTEPAPTEDLNPIPAPPAATAAVAEQPSSTEQPPEEAEPVAMAAS
jgi:hypothetical protein